MPKKVTLPSVSILKAEAEVEKINPAEMSTPKRRKRGKGTRRAHDPQAALLAARKKMFGTVAPSHEDATEQRKDRAVDAGGESFVDGQRIRRIADPLEALYRRKRLYPSAEGDKTEHPMNAVLYHAATRFREKWFGSGLIGIGAQDLTRDVVDGGTGSGGASAYAASCADDVWAVSEKVGSRLMPYLVGLVVDEKPVMVLAGSVTDTKSRVLAEAIAMERVREALHRTAEVFRLKPDERVRAIEAWDGGDTRFEARGCISRRGKSLLAGHISFSMMQ